MAGTSSRLAAVCKRRGVGWPVSTNEKSPKEDLYCRTVSLHEASTSRSPWRPAIALKISSGEPRQSFDTRSAAATSRVGSHAIMSCGGRQDGILALEAITQDARWQRAGALAARQKLTRGLGALVPALV